MRAKTLVATLETAPVGGRLAQQTLLVSALLVVSIGAFPVVAHDLVGWLETAKLQPEDITLSSKLDTGADVSSLGADAIQVVETDGVAVVRFRIQGPGGGRELQRPLVRTAWIKQHGAPPYPRPVVRLRICVGGISKEVEVSLVDRSNYQHPLLIGRNFLVGDLIVDPGATFSVSPTCPSDGRR